MNKSTLSTVLFIFISLGLIFFFNNCSNPIGKNIGGTLNLGSQLCPTQLTKTASAAEAFQTQNIKQKIQTFTQSEFSDTNEYVALVSPQCIKDQNQMNLSKLGRKLLVRASSKNKNRRRPYVIKITRDEVEKSLSADPSELTNDPCLMALAPNRRYKVNLLASDISDEQVPVQDHIKAAKLLDAIPILYSQNFGILENDITPSAVVAVIDTGVNYDHPDIEQNILRGPNGVGVDANTLDQANMDPVFDGIDIDANFTHGTHVAGIIAARGGNGIGVSGIAPQAIKILPINVFFDIGNDEVGATTETVIKGINWAVEQGVDVINMSLGGPGADPLLLAAIEDAVQSGVVVVAAAGNDGQLLNQNNVITPAYYGADIQGMITVGSVDTVGLGRSFFSTYGIERVELAAFGSENPNRGILSISGLNNYRRLQGTSQATPQVSAAAALIKAYAKKHGIDNLNAAQVEKILSDSAIKSAALKDQFKDGNILDLYSMALLTQTSFSNQNLELCK